MSNWLWGISSVTSNWLSDDHWWAIDFGEFCNSPKSIAHQWWAIDWWAIDFREFLRTLETSNLTIAKHDPCRWKTSLLIQRETATCTAWMVIVWQCVAVCCSVLQCVNSRVYVFSYSCTKHRCWSKELPPRAQPAWFFLAEQNKADSLVLWLLPLLCVLCHCTGVLNWFEVWGGFD